MLTIYLAGPISGLSYDTCTAWRKETIKKLNGHFLCLDPMRHKQHLKSRGSIDPYEDGLLSRTEFILARDLLDIDRSDVLLVNLLGTPRVSVGTVAELGYARARAKRIVVALDEPDSGVDNPHEHPFVRGIADLCVGKLEDAITAIRAMR